MSKVDLGERFVHRAKSCPGFRADHFESSFICPRSGGNHSELGKTCLRFGTDFPPPCINVPQIQGKQFRHRKIFPQIQGRFPPTVHKRTPDSGQIIPTSENLPPDPGQVSTPWALASPRFQADFCTQETITMIFRTDQTISRMPCSRSQAFIGYSNFLPL